jgi:hypothetical protein
LEVEKLLHPFQDAAHSRMRTWSLGLRIGFNKKMKLHKNSQVSLYTQRTLSLSLRGSVGNRHVMIGYQHMEAISTTK